MNLFLAAGIIFLFALAFSKLLGRLKFPAVTSYLILGILIGPYCLRLLPENLIKSADSIGYLVLGLIAFCLGEGFLWRQFRRVGKMVIVISCFQTAGAVILVALGLLLIGQPVSLALVLGGIAAATAPMATVMVVREYKAKGSFTSILLDVVALDDAWGIIVFAIAVAVAKLLISPLDTDNCFISALSYACREIFGALILGGILGLLLSTLSRFMVTQMDILIYTLGFILAATGISLWLGFSPLLANMALGAIVMNLTKRHLFFDALRRIDWPFYLLFFVLCGASLEIPLLQSLSLLAVTYAIGRILGKCTGAYLGGRIVHAEEKIRRYLGIGLLPQAGVSLGLAIVAKSEFPSFGNLIFTTIIATTVLFEMFGPFCTKFAIGKAGEIEK